MTKEIMNAVNTQIFGVWFLIGAALVFWMQAGFAMVEAGFTRAKNAGNIIMKNLMDFCIGTCVFILIGFSLLLGEDMIGLIGKPGFDIFTSYANFDWSSFVFNLVFCATTATIVSGAMAERTKFLSYCIYSAVISALIYPIEAHWIWGGGWLSQMGFHDFAGSCAIHMVGGLSALIGAKFLGPRIGKFTKDKDGNITKVNARMHICKLGNRKMRIIISNKIRCKRCGDVIESKSHYDLEKCSGGLCCVDGGKDYVRRVIRTTEGGKYADYCEELSEWVEVPDPNDDDGT